MARALDDAEIGRLLSDPKPVPQDWRGRLQPRGRQNAGHKRRSLRTTTETGDEFRVDTRQSAYNHLDFSIILTFIDSDGMEYRLLRCNGVHASKHTNKIEHRIGYPDATIEPTFHVHMATERYQEAGYAIDGYAEPTKEYVDFKSAVDEFARLARLRDPLDSKAEFISDA